jgi:hypothetical protein
MFDKYLNSQFKLYNDARKLLISQPQILIELERYLTELFRDALEGELENIVRDYNEASYLYPFWQNYPPDNRGRMPRGDQFPWIEVGEHAIGDKLPRLLRKDFEVEEVGIPTGPDERLVVSNNRIKEITNGLTSSAWLFIDIKSAGPRDDAWHSVMSHNQISGNGEWTIPSEGVRNKIMTATGLRRSHPFHSSVPPLFVLSDGRIVPVVNIVLKPVYGMESLTNEGGTGQPLSKIVTACIPNGLLLEENPGYLKEFPGLLFPGKDDKTTNPMKVRARVSFEILETINKWRVESKKLN